MFEARVGKEICPAAAVPVRDAFVHTPEVTQLLSLSLTHTRVMGSLLTRAPFGAPLSAKLSKEEEGSSFFGRRRKRRRRERERERELLP